MHKFIFVFLLYILMDARKRGVFRNAIILILIIIILILGWFMIRDSGIIGNLTLGSESKCFPGQCDNDFKLFCNKDGVWQVNDYCENCEDEMCQNKKALCGDGICEKYLDENLFSCFADCKYGLLKNAILLEITVIILIIILIFELKVKRVEKRERKYIEILKSQIKKFLNLGYRESAIKKEVIDKKWPVEMVDQAMKEVKENK